MICDSFRNLRLQRSFAGQIMEHFHEEVYNENKDKLLRDIDPEAIKLRFGDFRSGLSCSRDFVCRKSGFFVR